MKRDGNNSCISLPGETLRRRIRVVDDYIVPLINEKEERLMQLEKSKESRFVLLVNPLPEAEAIDMLLQSANRRTDFKKIGLEIANIVHADEACASVYGVCAHFICERVRKSDRNIEALRRVIEACNPFEEERVEVLDIMFGDIENRDCSLVKEYDAIRKKENFRPLCKTARDALSPFVETHRYKPVFYPLV